MTDPNHNPYAEEDFDDAARLVQQRQRYRRGATQAVNVINKLLARKGYAQTQSISELESVWQTMVGERWKDKTQPGNVNRGVFEVTVASSVISHHLSMNKKKLLAELKDKLPQNNINDIRFRVGKI